MQDAARRIVQSAPDVLVVISPHAPRDPVRWGITTSARVTGDFAQFGVPGVRVSLPGAPMAARQLAAAAEKEGVRFYHPPSVPLDHGALVPLYFVAEAGWSGPTLVIALPMSADGSEEAMGRAIAHATGEQSWTVLASGDLSHRLTPGAPAGFDPRACEFDNLFATRVTAGDLHGACSIDAALRGVAAEDVVESTRVAAAAVGWDATGHETLAYEGPFGVGYLEAVLHDETALRSNATTDIEDLPTIARAAILAELMGRPLSQGSAREPRGVFVTLRNGRGALRGCIGSIEPATKSLEQEVARSAVRAAFRDSRFSPVTRDELDRLTIDVSLVGPLERIESLSDLDPSKYGVIVTSGARRGVLLPDIPSIDSVEEQLQVALSKGGIEGDEPITVHRFTARKVSEG